MRGRVFIAACAAVASSIRGAEGGFGEYIATATGAKKPPHDSPSFYYHAPSPPSPSFYHHAPSPPSPSFYHHAPSPPFQPGAPGYQGQPFFVAPPAEAPVLIASLPQHVPTGTAAAPFGTPGHPPFFYPGPPPHGSQPGYQAHPGPGRPPSEAAHVGSPQAATVHLPVGPYFSPAPAAYSYSQGYRATVQTAEPGDSAHAASYGLYGPAPPYSGPNPYHQYASGMGSTYAAAAGATSNSPLHPPEGPPVVGGSVGRGKKVRTVAVYISEGKKPAEAPGKGRVQKGFMALLGAAAAVAAGVAAQKALKKGSGEATRAEATGEQPEPSAPRPPPYSDSPPSYEELLQELRRSGH